MLESTPLVMLRLRRCSVLQRRISSLSRVDHPGLFIADDVMVCLPQLALYQEGRILRSGLVPDLICLRHALELCQLEYVSIDSCSQGFQCRQ